MPALSILFIRAALLWLIVGAGFGGVLLAGKAGTAWGSLGAAVPAHAEVLLFGWMLQLAFGVAFWILPRDEQNLRPRPSLAWSSFVLLNAGLAAALSSRAWTLLGATPAPRWILSGAAFAFLAGAAAFAAHAWPRVRSFLK